MTQKKMTQKPAHEYPFQKQRNGRPVQVFEKIGPFTMKVTNHGFYDLYEVAVTGGVNIIKQASRPGFDCIVAAFRDKCFSGEVPYAVWDEYYKKALELQSKSGVKLGL